MRSLSNYPLVFVLITALTACSDDAADPSSDPDAVADDLDSSASTDSVPDGPNLDLPPDVPDGARPDGPLPDHGPDGPIPDGDAAVGDAPGDILVGDVLPPDLSLGDLPTDWPTDPSFPDLPAVDISLPDASGDLFGGDLFNSDAPEPDADDDADADADADLVLSDAPEPDGSGDLGFPDVPTPDFGGDLWFPDSGIGDAIGDTLDLAVGDAIEDASEDPDAKDDLFGTDISGFCRRSVGGIYGMRHASCDGDDLIYCDGVEVTSLIDCSTLSLEGFTFSCQQEGNIAGCGVAVGDPCLFGSDPDNQVLCDGAPNGACVTAATGASQCINTSATCVMRDFEPTCAGNSYVVSCYVDQPLLFPCNTYEAEGTCRTDSSDVAYCGNLPVDAFCTADADGLGDSETTWFRCAPGLECVGESDTVVGFCEEP